MGLKIFKINNYIFILKSIKMKSCINLLIVLCFILFSSKVNSQIVNELSDDTSDFALIRNKIKNEDFFIRLDSNNRNAYFRRANLKYQLGQYASSITDLNQVLRIEPNNPDAYTNIGMCYVFLKDFKNALLYQGMAIKYEPNNATNYLNRAYGNTENKKYKEAIKDLDKAIELRNDYTKAYANRGETKNKLGDYKGAIIDFTKALSYFIKNGNLLIFFSAMPVPRATARSGSSAM
jgi:tetratricopeptide (TPR) repeat protein